MKDAIGAAVEFQTRNSFGLEQYNARLVQSLMDNLCVTLSELDRESGAKDPLDAPGYKQRFKQFEDELRDN